jgi:hypothetical protein
MASASRLAPLLALALATTAHAAPKPRAHRGEYDLSILGFNDGDPFRLKGAEAESILSDPDSRIFQFQTTDWMSPQQRGVWVKLADVVARFPERAPNELFKVYKLELGTDRTPEVLIVPTGVLGEQQQRFAPSVLRLGQAKTETLWAATSLPGERFKVLDIRDLNGDRDPEVLLVGEGGQAGFYQFMELVGHAQSTWLVLDVPHVNSLHFVDLDSDDRIEIIVRERVGRRGPASQWTYIDHVHRWTGAAFEPADRLYPRYHEEQTLPTLVGDLIDNHDARLPILEEKVAAVVRVRAATLEGTNPPSGFHDKKVKAINLIQKKQYKPVRQRLEALDKSYPYDAQVLIGLANVSTQLGDLEEALDAALRAVTCEPKNREAWWWTAVALTTARERSSAVASLVLAARVTGPRDEGLAYLKARRNSPGMDADLQSAVDEAIAVVTRL